MVTIAKTGWYSLTVSGVNYYLKSDAQDTLESGLNEIVLAGHEGARYDAVYTGYKKEVTVDIYDGGDNFAAIDALITGLSVGDCAMADSKATTFTLTRKGGTGVSSLPFTALPKSRGRTLSNKDGHYASVLLWVFQAAPSIA